MDLSPLQRDRYKYMPRLPEILKKDVGSICIEKGTATESISDQAALKEMFPSTYGMPITRLVEGPNADASKIINVGVVLSGGQAPGGHNVIAGLFDGIKAGNPDSKLYGFLGGPSGLVEDKKIEITSGYLAEYRNTGGFDIIGSGRTKLESEEQFNTSLEVCRKNNITAIVIIGGDDSNTNAAMLAEYFKSKDAGVQVIGCPKTIDGDLKNEHIETSFGFDTATKTYSELIGNIQRDANSAKKYWHFIKLMGRSASHICLECALQTQPTYAVISEEVEKNRTSLSEIVDNIADIVVKRAANNENFGVVLVPEGLIEFIPEMGMLISEVNDMLAEKGDYYNTLHTFEDQAEWINKNLSKDSSYAFSSLPSNIQRQLLMDRDPHGNVQVSRIETEILLIDMVESKLAELKSEGKYSGLFSHQHHFFGYEGRCAFPSNFDADYCYGLGYTAFILISGGLSGYMSSVKNLSKPSSEWIAGGIPVTMMMNLEVRHGRNKPVIKKALVEMDKTPFKTFASSRKKWAEKTSFRYPGAIQYYGPDEICNAPTVTLKLEHE
ncbi:MAG: diphosphate--fructose-6-phosphate 1-phosphotransferase [Spirochaetales bacterium]|nr:diphosphate--fructose-6-phosphate 1-phosphotransferase [Spirochaetales bacterium]